MIRHTAGLAVAALLALAAWVVWRVMPGLLAGTPLQDLRLLTTFLTIVGLLSLAERVWTLLPSRKPDA